MVSMTASDAAGPSSQRAAAMSAASLPRSSKASRVGSEVRMGASWRRMAGSADHEKGPHPHDAAWLTLHALMHRATTLPQLSSSVR